MGGFENINNKDYIEEDENLIIKRRKRREEKPVITDRSMEEYQVLFNVNFAEMKGKTILDIGSGRGDFCKKVSTLGVKIVSINPEFKKGKGARYAEHISHEEGDVGARAQEMPFADDSFDSEFALYSVPYYLPRHEGGENIEESEKFFIAEFERVIDEMIRTLKPGGKAYIYPIDKINKNDLIAKQLLQQRLDKVSSETYDFEWHQVLVLTKK